nr:uncharacterized protein CTRU02_03322 [Colletotrichum truncatum]KAF6797291.1 hypothetical protein CTRU02_03322 [Colletotrichum truncatum]
MVAIEEHKKNMVWRPCASIAASPPHSTHANLTGETDRESQRRQGQGHSPRPGPGGCVRESEVKAKYL